LSHFKIEIPQYIFDYAFAKIQRRRPYRLAAANEHQLEHTNWQDMSGANTTSQISIPTTNANEFFRLIYP
jgi:hypothetical protein